jgi:hypothetical protein
MIIDMLGQTSDTRYQPHHMHVDGPNVSAWGVLINSMFANLMMFSLV